MKSKLLKPGLLLMLAIVSLTLSDCNKNNIEDPEIVVVDIRESTNWDYAILGKDGSSLFLKETDGQPSSLYYKPTPAELGYSIFIDESGKPSEVVIQDKLFVFNNYRSNLVDVAQVNSDGEVIIYRDLAVNYDWTTQTKSRNSSFSNSELFKMASISAGTASCVVGIIWAIPTAGISAAVGCGLFAASIFLSETQPEKLEAIGITSSAQQFIAVIGCINGDVTCLFDIAAAGFEIAAAAEQDKELKVVIANDHLTGGTKNGLIGYYPFNGNANDESGTGNNGTVYLATLTNDRFGNVNKAYSFNGRGNLVVIQDNSSFTSTKQTTISAWTLVPATWVYNSHWIVCKETNWSSGFGLGIDQNDSYYGKNNYAFEIYCWTNESKYAVMKVISSAQLKEWNHVVGVVDGTTAKLYVNGEMATSVDISGTIITSNNPVHIGAQNYRTDQNFVGTIDDVRIYNRALTAQEIKILYHENGWRMN
ncbi:MAG: LamG domain-containing protein [Bacteroidales bacterium]